MTGDKEGRIESQRPTSSGKPPGVRGTDIRSGSTPPVAVRWVGARARRELHADSAFVATGRTTSSPRTICTGTVETARYCLINPPTCSPNAARDGIGLQRSVSAVGKSPSLKRKRACYRTSKVSKHEPRCGIFRVRYSALVCTEEAVESSDTHFHNRFQRNVYTGVRISDLRRKRNSESNRSVIPA